MPSAALLLNHDGQLYNRGTERGENIDVAAQYPDEVELLFKDWNAYVQRVGAVNPLVPLLLLE